MSEQDRADAIPLLFLCLGLDPNDYTRLRFAQVTASEFESGESPDLKLDGMMGERVWNHDRIHSYARGRGKKWNGSYPTCGVVYEIEAVLTESSGSIWPGTKTHKGMWPDSEARHQWGAMDDARRRELESVKESTKDDWREGLEPIRDAYRSMRGPQRVQMIARVVAFITS
jgi:hypothetical protein